ncbi:hypothetical protein ABZ638_31055 [Streptomyces sp. NPDC007107]|uniref:hypothetical protein n=1 Tax=Streptomyces sp. NPDC007107 TaxID=3156915 RepID=UPI0033ED9AF8
MNKLVKAGASRLQKAADSAVDPAVSAELQAKAASESADVERAGSSFEGGRVLGADDVTGTPEEQLAFVTERLIEIDQLGRRAEDYTILNKGGLLEVAQARELHKVAGSSNFAQWAAGVLDVDEKYVFELLQDAARIRTVGALGQDLAQHLTKASARKFVAGVITEHGLETARVVMGESLALATKLGKKRPTTAILTEVTRTLTAPAIPPQEQRSEISDPPPDSVKAAPELVALERATDAVRARVYAPLAPAAVKAAVAADAGAARQQLEELAGEVERMSKRLAAAQRTAAAGPPSEENSSGA